MDRGMDRGGGGRGEDGPGGHEGLGHAAAGGRPFGLALSVGEEGSHQLAYVHFYSKPNQFSLGCPYVFNCELFALVLDQ